MKRTVLCTILALAVLAGCKPPAEKEQAAEDKVVVTLGKPGRMDVPVLLTYVGEIKGRREAALSFGVGGTIDKIDVDLGQRVAEGTVLAQLRQGPFEAGAASARAAYDDAVRTLERQQNLHADGLIADIELERMKTGVEGARAQKLMAEENLASSRITAPFAGYIATKRGETGESFTPMGGLPVITLIDYDRVLITVGVAEKDIGTVKRGQQVTFSVAAWPQETFKGTVRHIAMTLNPLHRTAEVQIDAVNRGRRLKSGMMAAVSILTGTHKNALVVPDNIVKREMGLASLFVVKEGRAVLRQVSTGATIDGFAEITGGLDETEDIITDGHLMVKDAALITTSAQAAKEPDDAQ